MSLLDTNVAEFERTSNALDSFANARAQAALTVMGPPGLLPAQRTFSEDTLSAKLMLEKNAACSRVPNVEIAYPWNFTVMLNENCASNSLHNAANTKNVRNLMLQVHTMKAFT